ncbi:MAG: hypothetical protein EA392_03070 [Cryomorphaceae bacterium]|nr:MAG: hypothetical protein EA392_03070 [Cryomorphaceae bacterium]
MKVYLDENMPEQIAMALNTIQKVLNKKEGTHVEVTSIVSEFGHGAEDEVWLPKVNGSIVITQDFNIQRTRHQKRLYLEHGVGMLFIKVSGKKGLDFWSFFKLLVKSWDEIRKVAARKHPPFAYLIDGKGKLKELE